MSAAVRRSITHLCREKKSKKRSIYIVDTVIYNADAVGAYNILRSIMPYPAKKLICP